MPAQPIASHTVSWPLTRLTAFLRRSVGAPRFLWESDHAGVSFAAFGAALEIRATGPEMYARIRAAVRNVFDQTRITHAEGVPDAAARPRLFGGFPFRSSAIPESSSGNGIWQDYSGARLVLPKYMLSRIAGQTYLTVNTPVIEGEEWAAQEALWNLPAPLDIPVHDLSPVRVAPVDLMDETQWHTIVTGALDLIHADRARKIVLARAREFPAYANPVVSISRLAGLYPDCYQFLFEPDPGHAFFGATPELLFSRRGGTLQTMALAGSIRRGQTLKEDEALQAGLESSEKERVEHDLVVGEIMKRLAGLVEDLHAEPRQVLKLSNIQHLCTPISGRVPGGVDLIDFVERLHPTPAVGGLPAETALDWIDRAEPVTRGWYAGPVGWMDSAGEGEFAVALRSAVTQGARTRLYAGAGIVSRSDPAQEWRETEWKFRPMMEALGCQ